MFVTKKGGVQLTANTIGPLVLHHIPDSDLTSCTHITKLLKGPGSSTDPEVYRLRITKTHSNRQTFGSTDSCFASTLVDASQRTTLFNIR